MLKAAKSCKSNFYDYKNRINLFQINLRNLKTIMLCVYLIRLYHCKTSNKYAQEPLLAGLAVLPEGVQG